MSDTPALTITDACAKRVQTLIDKDGNTGKMLRVTVSGGGCSGFQYGFKLDEQVQDDDIVFEKNGIKVISDEASLTLLAGSEIDFENGLMGSMFKVNNPNAESMCGCGTSFSIKF